MPRIRVTPDDLGRKILELAKAGAVEELRSLLGATGAAGSPSPPGGTTFANPMDAVGELIRGGTAGAPVAVPAGTEGQALVMVGGVPTWTAPLPGSATGKYRFPLYTTYAGGDLLFDTDGHLMYVLTDLE